MKSQKSQKSQQSTQFKQLEQLEQFKQFKQFKQPTSLTMTTQQQPIALNVNDEEHVKGPVLKGGSDECCMSLILMFGVLLYLYGIGLFVFGIVAISMDHEIVHDGSRGHQIWIICLLGLIATPCLMLSSLMKKSSEGLSSLFGFFAGILTVTAFIWGWIVYSNLSRSHEVTYMDNTFPTIWLFFQMFLYTVTTAYSMMVTALTFVLVQHCAN